MNHVAITAVRAPELDSVSVHIGDSVIARVFNVRKGLQANSHPLLEEEKFTAAFHRGEHSRPSGGRATLGERVGAAGALHLTILATSEQRRSTPLDRLSIYHVERRHHLESSLNS